MRVEVTVLAGYHSLDDPFRNEVIGDNLALLLEELADDLVIAVIYSGGQVHGLCGEIHVAVAVNIFPFSAPPCGHKELVAGQTVQRL
jgi:hypothetical protein